MGNEEAESYKNQANEAYKNQNYDEAIMLYTKAINLTPENAVFYGNRAAAYLMKEKFVDALDDCKKATFIDPTYVRGVLRAAKCLSELGRFSESIREYSKALELDPGNRVAIKEKNDVDMILQLTERAKQLIEQNNPTEALRYLEKASTLTKSKRIEIIKGSALIKLKQFERAASLMSSILQEDETNVDALYVRGEGLYRSGNHQQAIAHLGRVLTFDPDNQKAIRLLKVIRAIERTKQQGNDAFTSGDYPQAVTAYSSALELDPENFKYNATLYCNRAAALMKLGKYSDAVKDCTHTIELDESYLKAYKRRAACYTQLENHDDAVRDLEQAKRLDPNDREIKQDLQNAKRALKITQRKDYYKILGLTDKSASDAQIKTAYKKAALLWHPDRHSSKTEEEQTEAEKKFKDVSEAFDVLSDSDKRYQYDNGANIDEIQNGGGMRGHSHGGADYADIFSFMSGMGGMGGMGGRGGGGGGGFNFGGGRGGGFHDFHF